MWINLTYVILGTGKTATFAVGILQQLNVSVRDCQALVLAPTRELAQQIVKGIWYIYIYEYLL